MDAKEFNNQGLDLYRKGKYEESIKYFDKAIELDPNRSEFYNNKGKALKKLGLPECIACFNKAIDLAWPSEEEKD